MDARPFQLLNHTTQELLGEYSSQGKLLQGFYDYWRQGGDPTSLSMLYVDPETDEMTLFGYGSDHRWRAWFDSLQNLTFRLKLCGTDIIGLSEFLAFGGYTVEIRECTHPLNEYCAIRYVAWLTDAEGNLCGGAGSTPLAAMAESFVNYCERNNDGRNAKNLNHARVSV